MKVSNVQYTLVTQDDLNPQPTCCIARAITRADSAVEHMVADGGMHLETFFFGARLRTLCILLGTLLAMYLSV